MLVRPLRVLAAPPLVVGDDSRINLIEQFALPALDHRQTGAGVLIGILRRLCRDFDQLSYSLRQLAPLAEKDNVKAIACAFDLQSRCQANRRIRGGEQLQSLSSPSIGV